jgi:hypothetical protein
MRLLIALLLGFCAIISPAWAKGDSKATRLRLELRDLWDEHLAYTRNYVISAVAGLEDKEEVLKRLLRNQEDLGALFKPYYGAKFAENATELLKEHIRIAGEVVSDAMAGNDGAGKEAQERWSENGRKIADSLVAVNPGWKRNDLRAMMQKHLDLLSGQVTSRLKKDWSAEIKYNDQGKEHMMDFADTLAQGIAKQKKLAGR